jgi:hypothetical protein
MNMRSNVITCSLLCLVALPLYAQTMAVNIQERSSGETSISQGGKTKVSLDVRDSTRLWAIKAIARQAGLRPAFNSSDSKQLDARITIKFANTPALDAVNAVLKGSTLVATLASDGVTLMVRPVMKEESTKPANETGTVIGVVVDSATKKALQGATIGIAGVKLSTLTNEKGGFTLSGVPLGPQILTVKLVG